MFVGVSKTDPALGKKITSYYADKAPGAQYPPGMNDLFARIAKLQTDKTVDLSKMQLEQVIALNSAEKFKISVPQEFQRTGEPSAKPRPADDDDPIGPGGFITPPTIAVM